MNNEVTVKVEAKEPVKKTDWVKTIGLLIFFGVVLYIGYLYFGLPPQLQDIIHVFNPNTGDISVVCRYILENDLNYYDLIDGRTRCIQNPFPLEFPQYDCICYKTG